jgi:hypothetical protein
MGAVEDSLEGEELDVFRWRYKQFRDLGLSRNDAEWLACGDADLHQVADAVHAGCPTTTAVLIFA